MTIEEIKTLVKSEKYDFLRENPHLKDKIIFLTLGGSHAYGTNISTSDVDIRGCALNSPSDILGLTNFEQVVNNETDTTVYSFRKLISLLLSCNPNTIELLGCKPEYYIQCSDIGVSMLANRGLFLSRRAVHSFGGYANQQLRRLENALARDRLTQEKKEEHILKSMQRALKSFRERYSSFDGGAVELFTDKSLRDDLDTEIFSNIRIDKCPVREFNGMIHDLTNIVSSYEKLNHRNKKDENHLNKHAMHLVRLYLMCLDILEKEEIITYREKDRDFLLSIRSGEFQNEDGTYRSEFFEMINEYEKRLEYAANNTSLPDHPDMKAVEEFVMAVNRRAIDV